jgi:hypothetical protein
MLSDGSRFSRLVHRARHDVRHGQNVAEKWSVRFRPNLSRSTPPRADVRFSPLTDWGLPVPYRLRLARSRTEFPKVPNVRFSQKPTVEFQPANDGFVPCGGREA